MALRQEMAQGIYACWRLFRLDPDGVALLPTSIAAAARSFAAAAMTLPFYGFVVGAQIAVSDGLNLPRALAAMAIAYVVVWTAYPLLMAPVSDFLDRRQHFGRYLCGHNWSQVILAPLSAAAVAVALISGDRALSLTAIVAVTLIQISYETYVARHALAVPFVSAAGLIAGKLVIGLIVQNAANQLSGLSLAAAA